MSRFTEDILRSLDWVTLSAVPAGSNDIERRRLEFLKLLRLEPAITTATLVGADGRELLRVSRIEPDRPRAASTCQASRVQRCAHNSRSFQRRPLRRADRTVLDRRGAQCRTRWISRHCRRQPQVRSHGRVRNQGRREGLRVCGGRARSVGIASGDESGPSDDRYVATTAGAGRHRVGAPSQGFADDAHALDGSAVLAAYAKIAPSSWTVFVEQPRAEAIAPLMSSIERSG